ncbi:MAG: nuclear transport factor 2 family protein [Candidatus Lambdaproteobacteria bacterium]|nr:nuclear transport factor 2 family protein [Candidatus Lambdaproteobacteria bacterium]
MTSDTEARLAAVEAQVQRLSDIEAVRQLRHRYHQCINEGAYDEIPLLFTEDGWLDFSYIGKANGRATLTKFFASMPRVLPFVKQFIHNHIVNIDGNRASAVSYMEARTINNGEAFIVAGRYDDDCVRQDGEWRFKSMTFEAYYTLPHNESWAQDDRFKMVRREGK